MAKLTGKKNIAFLSTYSPRECGLATFTEDLVNELGKNPCISTSIIAVANHEEYNDPQVKFIVGQHDRASYLRASLWANHNADLLVIEHEYGIFGGECGEYIVDLVKRLTVPFVLTTHTVLQEPSSKQRSVLHELGRLSARVVTMARSSMPLLSGIYGIEANKLVFIPHGVPGIHMGSREKLKKSYGLHDKQIVSSFGLISPAKGLEYGIEAIAKVVPAYADLVYLILGKTHPCVKESAGESYRQSLMNLAEKLGVRNNVRFIDKYLTKPELISYLQLSDLYLTPYLSKEQAVSGTLAYAMGCGRIIVSTPYRYAREMLGEGRGLLADFRDSDSLAACIRTVLQNPLQKKDMEMKTLAVGKLMTWSNVAASYARLCGDIIGDTGGRPEDRASRMIRPLHTDVQAVPVPPGRVG